MINRFTSTILLLSMSSYAAAGTGCESQIDSEYFVDLDWQAPTEFVDGRQLEPSIDVAAYEIWLVSRSGDSISKEQLLAIAGNEAVRCRVQVPDAGEQLLAMVAKGRDGDSTLSSVCPMLAKRSPGDS